MATDFSLLIGNDTIKTYLMRMIERNTIANSLLFAGPEGIGKSLFAEAFAGALITYNNPQDTHKQKIASGNHPDIIHFRPEGKLGIHSMQALRQLCEDVYMPPYEANKKVIIIHEADRMLSYSANALLKTFEEPPAFTVIILLSSNPASLLPTILSRCRAVYFHAISSDAIELFIKSRFQLDDKEAQRIAIKASGSLSRAINLVENADQSFSKELFPILSRGFATYKELTAAASLLTEHIESKKKQAEQNAKEMLYHIPSDNMTSQMQHALEKELEGIVSMTQVEAAHDLFETVLSWYRDLHLLSVNADKQYLINVDYVDQLEEVFQRDKLLSLEQVQKIIEEARLALQRSMSLQVCLETLFLKLNLLS